jgi:hypothetical protein
VLWFMVIKYPDCQFFGQLLFASCYINFNNCLHSVDYCQLTDEMYLCDSKLVCQIHIYFVQLFAATISFEV